MQTDNPVLQGLIKQADERQKKFEEQMKWLQENLDNGTAGVKQKNGQWYIEVGDDMTYEKAVGYGGKVPKVA